MFKFQSRENFEKKFKIFFQQMIKTLIYNYYINFFNFKNNKIREIIFIIENFNDNNVINIYINIKKNIINEN